VSRFPKVDRSDGPPWRLIRVASLNRVKDYPTLLRALAHLVARVPDVHLDIVGEDILGGAIQSMADGLGLRAYVTFHGGQPTERVSMLYARAHLNLVSSRHESANVTVLEAASTGLPTVGTAVGYVAELEPDGAVAVPVQEPVALAAAIERALHDRERRERLGAAARAWTIEHDVDWTARQFERLYTGLVSERPRQAPRSDSPQSA